jgi:hypothetical protein
MKLRLRGNSIRLRLNREDVDRLALGNILEEQVFFPGSNRFCYCLEPSANGAAAHFDGSSIRITVPLTAISEWAASREIGLYFDFQTGEQPLKVAIEKDLECLHDTGEEPETLAFPRTNL